MRCTDLNSKRIDNAQVIENALTTKTKRSLELVSERNFSLTCEYNHFFEITNYFINNILVTQADLICKLADLFENQETENYISDQEFEIQSEKAFLQEHRLGA